MTTARLRSQGLGVYEEVRDLIVRGRLSPGTPIVELSVAARLGVSRTPAREAMQRLAQDGFLAQVGRGTRSRYVVSALTLEGCNDLYATMAALEGVAVRSIVHLRTPARRTLAAEAGRLQMKFELVAGRNRRNYHRLFEAHQAFHERLVRQGVTPWIRSLIALTQPLVDRYEFAYAPIVGGDYRETFGEHRDIVRAVRDGTAAAIENAVKANWLNSAERLKGAMATAGPRGDW